ncbi:MAG: peptidase M3, partial [Bacteroidetes bacterium]|nr:peptidase M3 [Bacteroidota bacterium]
MKTLFYLLTPMMLFCGFNFQNEQNNMDNPFFNEWKTPFKTPPFNEIKIEHYLPAYEEGMKQQKEAINAIVNEKAKPRFYRGKPTFENTIEAMEKSSKFLDKVGAVFSNLNSANT